MKSKKLSAIVFLAPIFILLSCKSDKVVTFESMLQEIVNRDILPRYPEPFYITRQFSSYDRESVARDEPGWFANWDRSWFIREDTIAGRREFVLMDAEGPGAIVRFWLTSGGPGAGLGTLRIYFDHEDEPAIEGSAFDVISGGQLTGKPLSNSVSPLTNHGNRGHNLYLHLPYSEHVKVTYESENITNYGAKTGGERFYYNINYRTYEPGTKVETFSFELLEKSRETLDMVNEKLNNRNKKPLEFENATTVRLDGVIEPGNTMEYKISGKKALRKIVLQLDANDLPQALRSVVMEMEFDGNRTVWCPVGDFFGTGYQIREVDTWYTHVTDDGLMRSLWVMPFKNNAVLRLHNYTDEPVRITKGDIQVTPWNWDRRSMHFGATWLNYTNKFTGGLKSMEGDGNPFDFNYTHLKGEGVVVGDVLTLFNTDYRWWGEGDEKIYIDGEDFPSHFGTGTEDYYGYAWSRPEIFNEPFIAQPDGSGANRPGYVVNIRTRSLDAMPFTSEIKFDMEMWHHASTWIDFAPSTFFYLKPGGQILIDPDIQAARVKVALKSEDIISPYIENNAIEGEKLIEIDRESGGIRREWRNDREWSHNQQLWWNGASQGSYLKLGFKSTEPGSRNIKARLTTAPDYGMVDISVNGSTPFRFDGYNDEVKVKEVHLGTHRINEGLNHLDIKMIRPGPGNQGMFGIDKLIFE